MERSAKPPRYPRSYLAADLIAGVTLWAVFAAQAIAYSRLAHASVAAGLVTAVAGALLYAALGSSRRISIGPAGGIAAIVGAAVAGIPQAHLGASLAALTMMTGLLLCIAGALRISFLQRLFPLPVFVGYLAGTGVSILIGQSKELTAGGGLAFAIGAAAIVTVLALKRLVPKAPAPFIVLVLATVASLAFDLEARGVAVIGGTLGQFGSLSLPHGLDWADYRGLIGPALGLALIVYVDALANADMLMQPDDPPVRPRREYFALGVVSLIAGVWGGFVAGTSSSRSIVGIRAGAKTRLASAIAGALLLLTALSVVRFLSPMPLAALAGVVFVAAFDLIDVKRLREMWHLRRADCAIALLAGGAVVVIGMVEGIVIGIVAALVEVFRRSMYPHRSLLSARTDDRLYESFSVDSIRSAGALVIYRFGAPLFFGNADGFLEDMRQIATTAGPSLRTVVINADALGIPDATARDRLVTARDVLARRGISLVFGNVRAALRAALERCGGFTLIDEHAFVAAVRDVRASLTSEAR